ncbi:MAG: tripartite tricarboxylate transporter substrate-binding protein, partial [Pigmentiphaga sp.]
VTAHSINPAVMKSLPYDTVKDFAPLALIARASNLLAVGPTIEAKTVAEFIDHVKRHPGKLNAGSHGVGNMSHLVAEMFKQATGTDFTIVQYKGAQPATLALMSGEIDFMFDTGTVVPALETGRVRIIGTAGKQRAVFFPDIPTLIESGISGFEAESWYGFLTTGGTPEPVIQQLSEALNEALNEPDVRERIKSVNMEAASSSAKEFDQLIKSQIKTWETTIKEAGIVFE